MARRVETAIHQGARAMAEDSLDRERSSRSEASQPAPATEPEARERAGRPRINAELLKALEALR
jgi:hypothetical protein